MTEFTAAEVCDLVGITYRNLDYWVKTGLVTPDIAGAAGPGSRRAFSEGNVRAFYLLGSLMRTLHQQVVRYHWAALSALVAGPVPDGRFEIAEGVYLDLGALMAGCPDGASR